MILVTGGFGFLGGHLIERLLNNNIAVHVVDDMSSAPIPVDQLLDELGHPLRLTYDIQTVQQYADGDGHYDTDMHGIFHLASPVGPAGILNHSGKMVQQIVHDTYAVMELALLHNCPLIFVSTSEVYGGGVNGLCSEDMPSVVQSDVTVRLEYAVAKLAAEIAVINTCKVTDLKATIIRPFNVAGERQSSKGGFVLPRFIEAALSNRPLPIFGTGQQIRAFTHVKDIVDGLMLAFDCDERGEVYNLGNPDNKTTILDLAHLVSAATGIDSGIIFMDGKEVYGPLYAEANDKYPDSTKAMRDLGWQPRRGISQTILDALEYQRKQLHAAK